MKKWVLGIGAFFFLFTAQSQQQESFSSIDWRVQTIDAPTPDSLARMISRIFVSNLEKTRAIYTWISSHIEYNTAIYKPWTAKYVYSPDPLDTASVWPSGDEMVARKVMRKRSAVCDGYARLFKVLCDYAGVEATIVQGYARVSGSNKFRTNHTWNAVKIDSTWKLVDVTWASGYLNFSNDYIQKQNETYFLTPPEQFINDHYPEELRWSLLANPPTISEFKNNPFRSKNFFRYGFDSFFPSAGIIEAAIGDTLQFTLSLRDVEKTKRIGNDPFLDTNTYHQWPLSAFLKPLDERKNVVVYQYIVQPNAEWLHLLYNDDVVLQYRLRLLDKSASLTTK